MMLLNYYVDGENGNMEKSLHLKTCQFNASLTFGAHVKCEEHEIGAARLLIFASFIQLFYVLVHPWCKMHQGSEGLCGRKQQEMSR